MPFHHPVNEGVVSCSDCHDVHGTFGDNNLRSHGGSEPDLHQVPRGHARTFRLRACGGKGRKAAQGATRPHGSQNARMLNMPSINTLCNQCHSHVGNDTVHSVGAGSDSIQPCTSCHTFIHGSNISPAFLR